MNIKDQPIAIEIVDTVKPCVYFLTDDNGEILYVGKTKKNLLGKIAFHKCEKQFNRSFFIRCSGYKEIDDMETKLILKYKPKYNKQISNNKSTGLLSELDIKKVYKSCDRRIIRKAAEMFNIEMTSVGSTRYYDKSIIKAISDYINSKKSLPLSWRE